MAKGFRVQRINETIREVVSELILYKIKDPRVGMVTITAARISRDLSHAKIYFSVMGDEAVQAESFEGLKSATNFVRRSIGQELDLRISPELTFVYDDSLDRAERIERKLRESGIENTVGRKETAEESGEGEASDEPNDA